MHLIGLCLSLLWWTFSAQVRMLSQIHLLVMLASFILKTTWVAHCSRECLCSGLIHQALIMELNDLFLLH